VILDRETARYCIIGDPVAHSLSPAMQAAAFAAAGISARYDAIRVPEGEAAGAIADLRARAYAGFNVTTPLKEEVAACLDDLTESARNAGAVNTVRRDGDAWTGHNTDGEGCARALHELWSPQFDGLDVLLLGAGPAARAIALALSARGARIACWSRRPERASNLGPQPTCPAMLVISALPADADVPPDVIDFIDPRADVFDINYAAARSPLAPGVGARRSDGTPMLLHQGALAFAWWTGKDAPLETMRAVLARAQGRAERPGTENSPR
jgi:shikimate dehydrogenase